MSTKPSAPPSIAVIGAGGVGGLFAAMLARAGNDVRMLARVAALAAIRDRGIRVRGPDVDYTATIARASDDPAALGTADVVLVTVKTWQIAELAPRLAPLVGDHTVVVPVQNGVEASDTLTHALGNDHVLAAVCRVISWAEQPGEIRWIGRPPSLTVGPYRTDRLDSAQACAALLGTGGIEVFVSSGIERHLWMKFLFIAPFGAVGAVERVPAGILRGAPHTRTLLQASMREVATLASACGVLLPPDAVVRALQQIDALPEDATTSMHRDIVAGRPSELHELIGAVVRLARDAGVDAPVSAELYAQLEPLERRARGG